VENPTPKVAAPSEEQLPLCGKRVIVVCKGFSCLGYVDKEGVWRDNSHSKELVDVIGWGKL
jgi:hypothetical protein